MKFDGERMIPEACEDTSLLLDHAGRYQFAAQFVEGKRVLDAATGAGYGARDLLDAGASQVVGVDISEETIAYAEERFGAPGITYTRDDVCKLDTQSADSFDVVACFETLEHVRKPELAVSQASRVLRQGGLFICSSPNFRVSKCQNPHHVQEFELDQFAQLLKSSFAHVLLCGQETFLATRIETFPPGKSFRDPGHNEPTRILPGGKTEEPPYFIALASNSPLPEVDHLIQLGKATDIERSNQYIQRLEGGVAERDSEIAELKVRIHDLRIKHGRLEYALTHRLVQIMTKCDRLLGRPLSRTLPYIKRALLFAKWKMTRRADASPNLHKGGREGKKPFFSVLIPVYENYDYLCASIGSVLSQDYPRFECVLYDDASKDPRIRPLLQEFAKDPRVNLVLGDENLGISGATNRGMASCRGNYIAFLDCDDMLEPQALSCVADHIRSKEHRWVDLWYSNRVDIDQEGEVMREWDFANRSSEPAHLELMNGMFVSHLKVVRRSVLFSSGLFRPAFDSAQDYDFALRVSEVGSLGFINKVLYRHRVHRKQTTQTDIRRQAALAKKAKQEAQIRRLTRTPDYPRLVSIVILSLNRLADTKRCLNALRTHTDVPHEIILVDNGSSAKVVKELRHLVNGRENTCLLELETNLGCGGGRNHGASFAKGDYVVFLDNDIEVTAGWISPLLTEMDSNDKIAACCCRTVFPSGEVQFTGGRSRTGTNRITFDLFDGGKSETDLSTLEQHECDWVPAGATIFRRSLLVEFPFDTDLERAYEDNDWCLRVVDAGWRLTNSPTARVIHHHITQNPMVALDKQYTRERYHKKALEQTLLNFYRKHGYLIDAEDLYQMLGYGNSHEFMSHWGLAEQLNS